MTGRFAPGADIRVVSHTGPVGPVADLGENWKVPEMFPDVLVSRCRATHGVSRLGSFIDGHPSKARQSQGFPLQISVFLDLL